MSHLVLALDSAGTPSKWLPVRDAALYLIQDKILCGMGEEELVLRGGTNRVTGLESRLEVPSIICVRGSDFMVRNFDRAPALTHEKLFMRDRNICCYCAQEFKPAQLEAEHVHPKSRKGQWSWMNIVSACRRCNNFKADRRPEEAGMEMHYAPYVPSLYEDFLMRGRNVLDDQMEFLKKRMPKHSRLL